MKEVTENSLSRDYQDALTLHNKILANGQIAAQAIVDFSLQLKEMRDKDLYRALNYESFDEYVENAVGLKRRQAYTYIRAIERLGIESMTEHANLGITKLQLIANVAAEEREEFISAHPVADMSTKQLEEAVAELHKAREQISFLESELIVAKNLTNGGEDELEDSIREEYNTIVNEYEDLQAELENRKMEEQELLEKAKQEQEKAVEKAKVDAVKETTESLKNSLAIIEKEKSEAIEKASALEKQLEVSSNESSLLISFLFTQIGDAITKIQNALQGLDEESQAKYSAAVCKFLTQQADKINS